MGDREWQGALGQRQREADTGVGIGLGILYT